MQEYVSLPLAKEIAERYARLGVGEPEAGHHYREYAPSNSPLSELVDDVKLYTAAEIFAELPVGITVTKVHGLRFKRDRRGDVVAQIPEIDYECVDHRTGYPNKTVQENSLAEALGKMWLRVLDERVMEQTNQKEV